MVTASDVRAVLRRPLADGAYSIATGLGVPGVDKAADARPSPIPWMSPPELDAASVDGIIRRVIHAVPEEALAQGWRTDVVGSAERDATVELDAALGLEPVLLEVGSTARQYGGCWSLCVHEGVTDLRRPLPERPGRLVQIHPLMGQEAIALQWEQDPRLATWTLPSMMQVTVTRPGISVDIGPVHRSHLLYMPGLPLSRTIAPPLLGYHLPVPVVYWDAVRDLGLAHRSAAIAAMEQSMVVLNLRGGQTAMASDQRQQVADALEMWGRSRSTLGTSVTTGEDTASRLEAPLSGLDGILRASYDRLTVPEGLSVTWLIGQAPGGLTTDDQASRRQTRRLLDRWRRTRAVPWLLEVYRRAMPEARVQIVWPDVDPPTDRERAEISSMRATRDAALVNLGAITADESRARFDGDEELDLPVLLDEGPLPEPVPEY